MNILKQLAIIILGALACAGCIFSRSGANSHWSDPPPYCEYCGTTLLSHGCPDTPVYIGLWQFISADGKVTNGKWWHHKFTGCHHDTDPLEFPMNQNASGVLYMWWDRERQRPYIVQEYLNGRIHGYSAMWNSRKQLCFIGILRNESWQTVTWFDTAGAVSSTRVRINDTDAGIREVNITWTPEDIASKILGEGSDSVRREKNDSKHLENNGAPTR